MNIEKRRKAKKNKIEAMGIPDNAEITKTRPRTK
jgi:hypothetical protein